MTAIASRPKATTTQQLKRWTVEEYHKISEHGLLDLDGHTELIAGQIIIMAAKGTPHVIALQLLALELDSFLRDKPYTVRAQDPIQLDGVSEPEPNLVVVQGDILAYADHHPYPAEIQLIVEVADSTLKYDCEVEDKIYAEAGIEEYRVIDLKNRQLYSFQQPTPKGYSKQVILKENNQISPIAFPELDIAIDSILSPV